MGTVYLGERIELFSQRVAIKLLNRDQSASPATTSQEAHTLQSLDHPNIVRLLDSGISAVGQRYLVMEYVNGLSIDQYCSEHQLTQRERLHLLLEVMGALAHAHRHLILHADLKPANILVTPENRVKLLDFGIASMLVSPGRRSDHTGNAFTPAFASPEQRLGDRLTVASDIYSLGVLTARLLATAAPLDLDLLAILEKSQSPAPQDRYASIDAFRADLRLYLEGRPVMARSISPLARMCKALDRHRLATAFGIAFTTAVLLSTVGIIIQSSRAAHQRLIAQDRLHDLVRLTGVLEGELYDSVAPLAQSEKARTSLLVGASSTLDQLSADNSKDAVLALELARQYERLAHLRISTDSTAAQRSQALSDVHKALSVLKQVPRSSREGAAVDNQTHRLLALQSSLSKS